MPARERNAFGDGHVGLGLAQTGGIDDLALDPDLIRLRGDRLDHKTEQSVSVVRIFEARVGLDGGRRPEFCHQFLLAKVWPAIGELPGIGAIAGEAGAV